MKKRKDCYFGLHFDMHANRTTIGIGKGFDPDLVREICREVAPDFIQVDSKGHPGYSSYPTKVGQPAPEIARDILKGWREVTRAYGIPLFAHYSGVFDCRQAELHPEWAVVGPDGKPSEKYLSFFGDYEEKILIPQLREIATEWGLDGAWIDGDCWAVVPDYSEGAQKAYGKPLPHFKDPDFPTYKRFLQQEFIRYVKRYMAAVKAVAPEFEITSNWCNSMQMPEDETFTDFISGDFSPVDSLDQSRTDARAIASFGRPWDLMAWGFSYPVHVVKPAVQVMQEAASVLMLGGGFQVYHMQDGDRTLQNEWIVPTLKQIAGFCRARQSFCHRAKPIHEVGVVFSKAAFYAGRERVFGGTCDYNVGVRGMTCALLDNQASVEVLMHPMRDDLSAYSLLALTDCTETDDGLKEKLLNYTANGGTLFLTGVHTLDVFRDELKLKETTPCDRAYVRGGEMRVLAETPLLVAKTEAKVLDLLNPVVLTGDLTVLNPPPRKIIGPDAPSLIEVTYGKGKILAALFDLGRAYELERAVQLREFTANVLARANCTLRVTGTHLVDVALMEKNGKTYLHLLNTAGEHRSAIRENGSVYPAKTKNFDEIPPVGPIAVEWRVDREPARLCLLPEGKKLPFRYENGVLKTTVDRVEIHSAIEITF